MKTGISILLSILLAVAVQAAPGRISTDLGVQLFSGSKVHTARKTNRARTGDRIGIYVRPHVNVIFYIVESDSKQARLVHRVKFRKGKQTILPPGMQTLKKGDWRYHLVAAPRGVPRLEQMFRRGPAPLADWQRLEKDLTGRAKIDLDNKTDKPVSLAANVRSGHSRTGPEKISDPFFQKLKTYSGHGLLIQSYLFKVR